MIPRNLFPPAADYLQHFPIVFLEGARQVGKSTLARELFKEIPGATFVNFDDVATIEAARENPTLFVEQSPSTLIIDEIQRLPDIFVALKASLERHRQPGRFLATGSVGVLKVPGNPESLAGRAVSLRVRGLSQGEIRGERDDFVSFLTALDSPYSVTSTVTRSDYIQSILAGGFPEMQGKSSAIRRAWFNSYVNRIVQKDAGIFPRGTQPERLRTVLKLIAAQHPGEMVYSRLANELDVSMPSVKDSVEALEGVFLVDRVPAWSSNLTKRELARPKFIVSDSGLAAHLMRESEATLTPLQSQRFGSLLEGFVGAELLKQQGWASTYFDLYHYREYGGVEVDWILVLEDGGVIGIEVKSTSDPRASHAKGLQALRQRMGSAWRGGVVFHTGDRGLAFRDDIIALPVSSLWQ